MIAARQLREEAILQIGPGCSLRCSFCSLSEGRAGASLEQVLSADYPIPVARRILMIGGDLIRRKLGPLVRRCREAGAQEVVLYAHPGVDETGPLEALSRAGISGLFLILPAADNRNLVLRTGDGGSIRKTALLIEAANRIGLGVECYVPVFHSNHRELPEVLERALNRIRHPVAFHLAFVKEPDRENGRHGWDFRRAQSAVSRATAIGSAAGVPVRFWVPAPPPCLIDRADADRTTYPELQQARRDTTGPFTGCSDCAFSGICPPRIPAFEPDPELGPIVPFVDRGSDDSGISGSPALFFRVREISTLLDRVRSSPPLRCCNPWNVLAVHDIRGTVSPCRGSWIRNSMVRPLGNWKEQSILDLWNSRGMQSIREAVREGRLEDTCRGDCPVAQGSLPTIEPLDTLPVSRVFFDNYILHLREMLEQRLVLESRPIGLTIAPSLRCCNSCITCNVPDQDESDSNLPDRVFDEVRELLPTTLDLSMAGAEPLYSRRFIELLRQCEHDRYPDLRLTLTTNGVLLERSLLKDLAGVRFQTMIVSVNAVKPETYDRVSGTRGLFDTVIGNVECLVEESRHWKFRPLILLSFLAMRSNFQELPAFVDLASSMGIGFRLLPVEGDRASESFFTDETVLRHVLEMVDDEVQPRVRRLSAPLQGEVDLFRKRLSARLDVRDFTPL